MRNKIRILSLMIVLSMLIASIAGCKSAPAADTDQTPVPAESPEVSAVPGEPTPAPASAPPEAAYNPVAEEELDEAALDAWMDMQIMVSENTSLPIMRDFIESSFSAVPAEVADAMVWAYIKALRDYMGTVNRYMLTPEILESLSFAYQFDGSFDRSALNEGENSFLDSIADVEIGWIVLEGMIEPRIEYAQLLDWTGPASEMMRGYIGLLAMDDDMPIVDGMLQIGFDELTDRTLAIEDFLQSSLDAPYIGDVEALYLKYLGLLLGGGESGDVLDMQLYFESGAFAMNDEAASAFQHVLDTRPDSGTAAAIEDWWAQLEDLIQSGATGEEAYQHIWDDFDAQVEQYASAAGVRVPRIFLAYRTEETDTDIFYARMEYPVLYGRGVEQDVLDGLNAWITEDLRYFFTRIQDQAVPDHDAAAEEGYELPPYGAYSVLRLSREAGPVVSVVADIEEYTGGAHGMPYRIGYNFDPVTGEQVSLEDLFAADAAPWTLLEEEVTRQIGLIQERYTETQGDTGYMPYDMYTGLTPDHEWYASDEGIVVIFQAYEIGPYAMGIPEFTVPWWRLADYLAQ